MIPSDTEGGRRGGKVEWEGGKEKDQKGWASGARRRGKGGWGGKKAREGTGRKWFTTELTEGKEVKKKIRRDKLKEKRAGRLKWGREEESRANHRRMEGGDKKKKHGGKERVWKFYQVREAVRAERRRESKRKWITGNAGTIRSHLENNEGSMHLSALAVF